MCLENLSMDSHFLLLLLAAACHVGGSDRQLDYVGGHK